MLAKQHASDAGLLANVNALMADATNGSVQSHLNGAGIYLARGTFQEALHETQKALAIDPSSAAAMMYRSRVVTISGLRE